MTKYRQIKKVFKSKPTLEGAGVHLHRAFGYSEIPLFDPFLLLDDFRTYKKEHFIKGFPWHPHRGIETITYVLKGKISHGDSMGNKGIIEDGDVQWMTAGSGIIHEEMPIGNKDEIMEGFQLWANLPAQHKMTNPRYQDVKNDKIPVVTLNNGIKIKIICGTVNEVKGPVKDIIIDPQYLDITIPPDTEYIHATKLNHKVFIYVIEGKALFCRKKDQFDYDMAGLNYFDIKRDPFISNGMLVLYDDGEEVFISTENEPVRLLFLSGMPLNEPIAWYGPVVMNTQRELQIAFEEYENGTFVKKDI